MVEMREYGQRMAAERPKKRQRFTFSLAGLSNVDDSAAGLPLVAGRPPSHPLRPGKGKPDMVGRYV
ncbi:hypothetical protein GCM10009765_07800 [Fodinicola feengrottensis]|uniref:Uncharacterized protein n=1 Tax=Fodinicola feengrottensis TaxID=435914 RepID=A0ABN2FW14_9ACTN